MLYICMGIIAAVAGADILTKVIFFEVSMDFIPGFVRIEFCKNTGMAWGLLGNATALLAIFSAVMLAAMLFALIKWRKRMPAPMQIALALVAGGTLGNLIDRAFLGYVRDFIKLEFIEFPTFNIADCAITIGGIMLVALLLFSKSGKEFFDSFDKKKEPTAGDK